VDRGVGPDSAVVFVDPGDETSLRGMLGRLGQQTIRERLEVVVVAPPDAPSPVREDERSAVHSLHVVPFEHARLGSALAIGVRHARAPFVALIEDHCLPEPGWAEALWRRHVEGYAVVGPEIGNANPDSSLSWCSFLYTHGGWCRPAAKGVVDSVAGDNSSYRRDLLLPLGEELAALLASGTVLHWELRAAGHQVYLEPLAKAAHVTPSKLRSYLGSRFNNGRLFAGLWSRRWSWSRRLYFAALSPLIACRGALRVLRLAARQSPRPNLLAVAALLLLAAPSNCLGYLAGFGLGAGDSARFSSDLYFHRERHLRQADRALGRSLRQRAG